MKTILRVIFVATFFSAILISCGDDSEEFITAKTSTFSFDVLNTCDIGSGALATSFDFVIEFEASDNIEVSKILFDLKWSNGDTESTETTEFSATSTRVEYDWCYRFGGDWVEITHRIETKNDITSNESVIKVNRPVGAN